MYLHAFVKYLIMGNKSLCSLFPQQIGINTEVNPGNSFIFKSLQILGYLPKWVNSTQRSRRPKATPVRGSPLGDLELNFPESVRIHSLLSLASHSLCDLFLCLFTYKRREITILTSLGYDE